MAASSIAIAPPAAMNGRTGWHASPISTTIRPSLQRSWRRDRKSARPSRLPPPRPRGSGRDGIVEVRDELVAVAGTGEPSLSQRSAGSDAMT